MDKTRFNTISEALYTYGASDLNLNILESISLEELIFISRSTQDQRASFRAAWTLEHILLNNNKLLHQYQEELIDLYMVSENWSTLRSVSKILIRLTKELKFIEEHKEEKLLEKTFQVLSDINCPIAVRCNAYDIIFALTPKYEWLTNELRIQIQFDLEKNSTPALSSRGLRVLKKLGMGN